MNTGNVNILPIIIPGIVAICSIAATVIFSVLGNQVIKHQNTINLITGKRNERLDAIKDEIADFIHNAWNLHFQLCIQINKNQDFIPETYSSEINNMVAKGYKLMIRLDPVADTEIIEVIKEFFDMPDYRKPHQIRNHAENLDKRILRLVAESQSMIKREQEKIEAEVTGNISAKGRRR